MGVKVRVGQQTGVKVPTTSSTAEEQSQVYRTLMCQM